MVAAATDRAITQQTIVAATQPERQNAGLKEKMFVVVRSCMVKRGYAKIVLTENQRKEYDGIKGAADVRPEKQRAPCRRSAPQTPRSFDELADSQHRLKRAPSLPRRLLFIAILERAGIVGSLCDKARNRAAFQELRAM